MSTPSLPHMINDRYEVGETIGRGGMATVHLGQDTRLGRKVAIKVLRPELAADETFHERFQREAHAVAQLNHHSIVSIYDTGEITPQGPDGVLRPYIVMEFVPGRTLRELMLGDGIEPRQALEFMSGILDALTFSHRAGIVHRDIKPANVKVTPEGGVKVMDFGIARAVEDTQAALTQTQAVLGTAQYLSPEQARGEAVDPRSDLYSAACVLFEMLTGRAPFVGESSVAIAAQHVRDAPPRPSALNPALPPEVDRFFETALAKDRDYRFADAAHMARELRALVPALPGDLQATRALPASSTAGSSTKALPVVGAGAVAAAGPVVAAGRGEDSEGGRHAGEGHDPALQDDAADPALDPRNREDRRGRRRGWLLPAVLLVLLLTGLGIGGVVAYNWWQDQQEHQVQSVKIPEVKGMDRTTAENTLRDAGLDPTFTEEFSDSVEDKRVISVSPEAGSTVDEGSRVSVSVSKGKETVKVPDDLVGQSLDYAKESLADAGLKTGPVSAVNNASAAENVVLSSDPQGGSELPKDSSVKLQVSTGKVTVPDVVGKTRDEADGILRGEDVRLSYQVEPVETEDAAANTVVRQSAPAGSSVAQGSTIVLYVAKAPAHTPTPTPTQEPSETPTPSDTPSRTITPSETPSPAPTKTRKNG